MFLAKVSRRWGLVFALAVPVLGTASCSADTGEDATEQTDNSLGIGPDTQHKELCPQIPGKMRCHAKAVADKAGKIKSFATPSGFGPADLKSAYNLPSISSNATIAIVDAMDNPKAESDLAQYRSQFGLPPCTTANGCFKKVNQSGQTSPLPAADNGWSGEISLDLDMASAICPTCKILLVEATSATTDDLGTSVNTAVALGATVVSNSYGGGEDGTEGTSDTKYFNHPGVAIFASSGDSGFGVSYPASGAHVIGVGGTHLVKASNARGWTETVWGTASNTNGGAGSGCSSDVAKPAFQNAANTGCNNRAVADISAVADPATGVAVFDSVNSAGFTVYGGTSVASPLVASIFALVGKGGVDNSFPYANTSAFNDVTSGVNGTCSPKQLCTAGAGWDGPTGIGTPNGTAIQTGQGGDGGTDSGGGDSGGDSGGDAGDGGTDGGGGSCSHSDCTTGGKLVSGCDPCVTKICAADSFCCTTQWDSICVGEVKSICGQTCGGGGDGGTDGGGTCSHSECSTGGKLTKSCDACVTKICTSDPFCCNTTWDSICVSEVGSICGESCK